MTEQRTRGSAGTRSPLVIDGEAVIVSRRPGMKRAGGPAGAEEPRSSAETHVPRAQSGRCRPQPARRRKPPLADLIFQTPSKQHFALPAGSRTATLKRPAWIAGIVALAALAPLAAWSFHGSADGAAEAKAIIRPPATVSSTGWLAPHQAGTPAAPPTRLASAGESPRRSFPAR